MITKTPDSAKHMGFYTTVVFLFLKIFFGGVEAYFSIFNRQHLPQLAHRGRDKFFLQGRGKKKRRWSVSM